MNGRRGCTHQTELAIIACLRHHKLLLPVKEREIGSWAPPRLLIDKHPWVTPPLICVGKVRHRSGFKTFFTNSTNTQNGFSIKGSP